MRALSIELIVLPYTQMGSATRSLLPMSNTIRHASVVMLVALAAACARHSGDIASLTVGGPPAFETRVEIDTTSANHADYHVADLNGDTFLDMAVISLTGEVRVLFGNGVGFTVAQDLQLDGQPIWLSGGDFDQDGDVDLVVVRSEANQTNLLANDGNGGFSVASALAIGRDALAVSVGDINDDGLLDVVVSKPSEPEVLCGFGDGTLGFSAQTPLSLPGGGTAFNLAILDANRDGAEDLVVADTGLSRLVMFSGANGGVNASSEVCALDVPGTPGAVTSGDLNGDGLDDLVVSAFNANKYVVITDIEPPVAAGAGQAATCAYTSIDVNLPARPSLAKVGDVTGDGNNDIVCCLAFNATLAVVPGTGGNQFEELFALDSTGLPLRPFIGDFDQNGRDDVAALSGLGDRVNLWLASETGRLQGARSYSSSLPTAAWLEGADFDGDGDKEVVTGSMAATELSILGGDGALDVEFTFDTGLNVYQLKAGDLDGDGLDDLIVGVAGGVKILHNTSTPGNYSFTLIPIWPFVIGSGDYPFGMEVVDYDGDQDLDLIVCDYAGGGVHLIPGTAMAFKFDAEVIIPVGGGPVDVVAADFTGDNLPDLAVSRTNQSDVMILRNTGDGVFIEDLAVPVGISPNYLVTSDFNSDGRQDLVVSNAISGTVSVLFGGDSGFTGADYPAGDAPTALLAEDLTGDGLDDILVASLQSGDFRVLVGDGLGNFPQLPRFPGTLGASDAVLQDMTGDGLPELLISSLVTDRVSLVRNIRQ